MGTIIVPEVFADAVNNKLDTTLRIGRVAFDATANVQDVVQYGNTVHFPRLKRVVAASEVTKGTAITPSNIDMSDLSATIKQVAAAARIYDSELYQIKGGVMDQMVLQVAEGMAKKIDNDLVSAMDTDAALKETTSVADAITASELYNGMGLFNDDIDTASFAGIIINSRLFSSFMGMNEFTSVEKTYQTAGNGIVVDGVIGYFAGLPVIVCNNGTYDSTASECKTYMVKRNALGYIFQKNIAVEEERVAKELCTDIVASSLYATKLLDTSGVVILRKTIA